MCRAFEPRLPAITFLVPSFTFRTQHVRQQWQTTTVDPDLFFFVFEGQDVRLLSPTTKVPVCFLNSSSMNRSGLTIVGGFGFRPYEYCSKACGSRAKTSTRGPTMCKVWTIANLGSQSLICGISNAARNRFTKATNSVARDVQAHGSW